MSLLSVRKLRHGLITLALALPALYVVLAGLAILHDYRTTVAQAETDMRSIAATLNEHALRTFSEADTRLQAIVAEIERRKLSPTGAHGHALHRILAKTMQESQLAGGIGIVSPDGWMRASASAYPMAPIDQRDREYFAHLSLHAERSLYLARSLQSRSTGKWVIPVSRRVSKPDGTLRMIVGYGVDMGYFDHFYRSLHLGKSIRLMLMRRDGWVLMETPLAAGVMDRNLGAIDLFKSIGTAPAGAYQTPRSVIDGSARVVGYASLTQSPMIAVASIGREEVLQPWLVRSWRFAGLGAISTIVLLWLLRLLWMRLADLEAAQTGLAHRNKDLDAARQRFQGLVDGVDGVVWEAALPNFRFIYVSANAGAISGFGPDQWMADPDFWHNSLCTGLDGRLDDPVLAVGKPGLIRPIEHHIVAPDGRQIWLRSNVMLASSHSSGRHVRGVTIDITLQKQFEMQLFEAIHVDAVTGLPSRRALVERLEHAVLLAERNRTVAAIVFIDIDNFGVINDSLGHLQGDAMLAEVAQRLQTCLGPGDILARMGGDEFAVIVENVERVALTVEHLAERVNRAFARKIVAHGRELYLTLSMGFAMFPQDGGDYASLMRNAGTALCRAKAAGRNSWQFFDSSMARQVEQRLELETALRHAIEHEEFRLFYQPQRSLRDGSIVGAEALVRWERPGMGLVPTQEFIDVAEQNGHILALGNWVLNTACRQAASWHAAGLHLRMAVNVSVAQLQQSDFVEQVRSALHMAGLPARCLELEMTESACISDMPEAVCKLRQLKAMGVELAVDDFGTGYSSLSYLKQMPVDRLKIDQSFVRDIPGRADDCAIVRAILAMGAALQLEVIAEGVETADQLHFLQEEGCDEIQGFILSPPLSADHFFARFRNTARVPELRRVHP